MVQNKKSLKVYGVNDVLGFGRHSGGTIADIIELHPFYVREIVQRKFIRLDTKADGVLRMRLRQLEGK